MNDDITEINSYLAAVSEETNTVYFNLQREEWMSLIFTVMTSFGVVGCTIWTLIFNHTQFDLINFSLITILFINCAFLLYYMLNGIINEKEYDLYINYLITFILITTICTYEFTFHYLDQQMSYIKMIRLVICFAALPISVYLIVKMADEISWTEFKIVGASEDFQLIYRQAGYFISLLKLDCQLSICTVVLTFKQGPFYIESGQFILVSIAIPVCLAISIIGYKALRLESFRLTVIFVVAQFLTPIFICYQLYQIYDLPNVDKINDYVIIYASMVLDAMVIVAKGVLMFEMKMVLINFNKGLKERAFSLESDKEMQPLLYKVRRRKLKIINCC